VQRCATSTRSAARLCSPPALGPLQGPCPCLLPGDRAGLAVTAAAGPESVERRQRASRLRRADVHARTCRSSRLRCVDWSFVDRDGEREVAGFSVLAREIPHKAGARRLPRQRRALVSRVPARPQPTSARRARRLRRYHAAAPRLARDVDVPRARRAAAPAFRAAKRLRPSAVADYNASPLGDRANAGSARAVLPHRLDRTDDALAARDPARGAPALRTSRPSVTLRL